MIIQKISMRCQKNISLITFTKKPIILTGIIEQWKIHNFDLEKFGELYGNKTAPVRGSKKMILKNLWK